MGIERKKVLHAHGVQRKVRLGRDGHVRHGGPRAPHAPWRHGAPADPRSALPRAAVDAAVAAAVAAAPAVHDVVTPTQGPSASPA